MSILESHAHRELPTAAQMRALERHAMENHGVTGLQLMERAGRGVVAAAIAQWPELAQGARRALVLCGPGNNGGDGFVVARLLRNRGWRVDTFLYGSPERMGPDARANHDRWAAMGAVRPLGFPEVTQACAGAVARSLAAVGEGGACDLVVDALFGTGLVRAPDGLAALFDAIAGEGGQVGPRRVAVDLPSGLCSDSGRCFPVAPGARAACLPADLTVTFGHLKPGHLLERGPDVCGRLALVDIGLPETSRDAGGPWTAPGPATLVAPPFGSPPGPGLGKTTGHKYDHGHALVLAGGLGRTGAARLAARASLRVGAGLVTVAAPGEAMPECAAQLTAIMLRRCEGAREVADLLRDARLNAVCLGPGLGQGEGTREVVSSVLRGMTDGGPGGAGRAAVLDADALTAFSEAPDMLFSMLREVGGGRPRVVLTPHMGEFARLFPDLAGRLGNQPARGPMVSRIDAVRAAAERASAVVLLKGPATVIGAPDGRAAVHAGVHDRAAPWLATAGTGDVLSGLIAGLLARGFGALDAAAAAAWLHVEAARAAGPGLIAEDLPEAIPAALARALGGDGAPMAGAR
jgi:hydroxyethylthiazole kinase-like uncharacterized protein yjeF